MTTHVTDTPPSSAPQTPPQAAATDKVANGNPVPDRELLRRFVKLADEAAFAALVRRHSGLVIGVCRRVLRSEHDIEDAFQATFLVLARDAGRIRKTDSLASWLHGVAYRTSLRAADSKRRRGRLLRELTMIEDTLTPDDDSGPLAKVEQRHQQQALDEELASLPDNYRAALVLHYLDGKSNQQVADELGLSVAAVESRLRRGRKELRLRLARRGIGLSVAVAAMQAVQSSAQAAPLEPLIARAIDAGLSYAGGEAAGPVYTPEAARLAGQELMTMSTTTTATLAAVVLLPLALGFAGHAPVPGTAGSPALISTTLAQADADAAEDEAALPVTEALVGPVAEDSGEAVLGDDHEYQIRAIEEDGARIIITYTIDGEVRRRVVDLKASRSISEKPDEVLRMPNTDEGEVDATELVTDQKPAPQKKPESEVLSIEEKNGHVIIKYKTPDGAINTLEFDKIEFDQQVAAAQSRMVDPAHQPPAAGRSVGGQTRWAYVDPLTGSTSAPTAGAGMGMVGGDAAGIAPRRFGMGMGPGMAGGGGAPSPEAIRDYADLPASEQKVAEALKQPRKRPKDVQILDEPLSDVIYILEQHNDIPILIDEAALEDLGLSTDVRVNLGQADVTLQTQLNLILRPLGLTTIIRDEMLQVTSKEVADAYLVTRVYDIRDLAELGQEQLLQVLQESLPDADWKDNGGGGTAAILDDALVVKQSQSAHRQIVDLLGQLRRHLQQRSQATSRVIEQSSGASTHEGPVTDSIQLMGTDSSQLVGIVLATRTDASEQTEYAEISLGRNDGLRLNETLQVYRSDSGTKDFGLVARIEIDSLTAERAIGRVLTTAPALPIQRGDHVVRGSRGKRLLNALEALPRKELTLDIDADGRAWFRNATITTELLQDVLQRVQRVQRTVVVLRVDPSASSEAVSRIIDAAKAAGIPELKFALRVVDPDDDAPATEAADDVSDAGDAPAGWQAFSDERLTSLLVDKRPVLVHFTADWCLVCKQNDDDLSPHQSAISWSIPPSGPADKRSTIDFVDCAEFDLKGDDDSTA